VADPLSMEYAAFFLRQGWSDECDVVTGKAPEMRWNDHIGAAVLRFCLHCYAPKRTALDGRCLLSDFSDEELANFPPTLLLCGSWDPLIYGNREMNRRLSALNRSVQIEE
jgi:acetyl esterase/lipase